MALKKPETISQATKFATEVLKSLNWQHVVFVRNPGASGKRWKRVAQMWEVWHVAARRALPQTLVPTKYIPSKFRLPCFPARSSVLVKRFTPSPSSLFSFYRPSSSNLLRKHQKQRNLPRSKGGRRRRSNETSLPAWEQEQSHLKALSRPLHVLTPPPLLTVMLYYCMFPERHQSIFPSRTTQYLRSRNPPADSDKAAIRPHLQQHADEQYGPSFNSPVIRSS